MITKKTKQVALLSGVVMLGMIVAVVFAIRLMLVEADTLSEQVQAIAVDQPKCFAVPCLDLDHGTNI